MDKTSELGNRENSALLSSQENNSRTTRRGFLRKAARWLAAGVGVAAGIGQARTAEAAPPPAGPTPPAPEKPPQKPAESFLYPQPQNKPFESKPPVDVITTENLKARQTDIEKQIKTAENYLPTEKIKVVFDSGKKTQVITRYHHSSESSMVAPEIRVRLSYEDGQPFDYTQLRLAEELAEIIRASKGAYIPDAFPKLFHEATGLDIKKIAGGNQDNVEELAFLRPIFDYANYTDGVSRDDMFTFQKDLPNELYDRSIAIITTKPKELADNLLKLNPANQKSMAQVFIGALKLQLDGVMGGTWESLGLDKESIYKVITISGNEKYKAYFDEKIAMLK